MIGRLMIFKNSFGHSRSCLLWSSTITFVVNNRKNSLGSSLSFVLLGELPSLEILSSFKAVWATPHLSPANCAANTRWRRTSKQLGRLLTSSCSSNKRYLSSFRASEQLGLLSHFSRVCLRASAFASSSLQSSLKPISRLFRNTPDQLLYRIRL